MFATSIRFVDRDYVLRLFPNKEVALAYPDAQEAFDYGCGWIAKCRDGAWVDFVGPMPPAWTPCPQLLSQN